MSFRCRSRLTATCLTVTAARAASERRRSRWTCRRRFLTEDEALTGRPVGGQMKRLATLAARWVRREVLPSTERCRAHDRATLQPSCKAGLEQFPAEAVDRVVERIVGREAALVGAGWPRVGPKTSQEIEPSLFAPHPRFPPGQFGSRHEQPYVCQATDTTASAGEGLTARKRAWNRDCRPGTWVTIVPRSAN